MNAEASIRQSRGPAPPLLLPLSAVLLFGLLAPGCGLFETRDPAPPSESNCVSIPATRPGIVLSNLQNAVGQKCVDMYAACFSQPGSGQPPLQFVPSAEAREQYAGVLDEWDAADEQAYFRNLVARSVVNGLAQLQLVPRDSIVTPDTVLYSLDYRLTFQHTDAGFPVTAAGTMRVTLAPDGGTIWRIFRWVDFQTTGEASWSLFKGRFSN